MGSIQLFTLLLLAISAIHLVFSALNAVDQWLLKNRRPSENAAKSKKLVRRSNWYVFFDPGDFLSGGEQSTVKKQPLRHSNVTRNQQPRPRVTTRL